MKEPGTSYKQKTASRDNDRQKKLRQTLVLCEIANFGKSSISIFQEYFSGTKKIFILGGRMGTRI